MYKQESNLKNAPGLTVSPDWNNLFGEEIGKQVFSEHKTFKLPYTEFPSGSAYVGSWDNLGMSGYGTYHFPHGVVYEGQMQDGQFHNKGCLTYPMGQKFYGTWSDGKLVSWKYQFNEGIEFNQDWNYCKFPDRRFCISLQEGLLPAGEERLTNDYKPRKIPEGCYDTGDGFYNPNFKCVFSAYNENKIIRVPNKDEEEWIIKRCRKAWDEPVGYRPDLYKYWTSGRSKSQERLLRRASIELNPNDYFWKTMLNDEKVD